MRHTLGLMVLLDLGRLVPALRRALMFAYRPGFELFISRLYHTHHLITNSVSAGAVAVLISKTLAQDYPTPFQPNYRRKKI
jgi:hypothetical protein